MDQTKQDENQEDIIPPPPTTDVDVAALKEEILRKNKFCSSFGKQFRKGDPIPDEHNLTHFPKHPDCEICNKTKSNRAQHRKKSAKKNYGVPDNAPKPDKFADEVTCDHTFCADDEVSRHGDTCSLVVQDRATIWLRSYAAKVKAAHEVTMAFQRYFGPKINVILRPKIQFFWPKKDRPRF